MQLQVKVVFWSGNWVQRRPSHEHTIISCVFVCLHPLRKGIWLKCAIIYELCILNAPLVLLLQLLNLPDHRQTNSVSSGRAQSTSGRSLRLCKLKRGCRLNTVRVQAEQKWLCSPHLVLKQQRLLLCPHWLLSGSQTLGDAAFTRTCNYLLGTGVSIQI